MHARISQRKMISGTVLADLGPDFSLEDPRLLETNPYDNKRYGLMLDLIRTRDLFESALEIGCAAGAFAMQLWP